MPSILNIHTSSFRQIKQLFVIHIRRINLPVSSLKYLLLLHFCIIYCQICLHVLCLKMKQHESKEHYSLPVKEKNRVRGGFFIATVLKVIS